MAKNRITKTTTVTTTHSNPTASKLVVPTNVAWDVLVTVVAYGVDKTERAAYMRRALVYRTTGSAAQQGSTQTIGTDIESHAAMDVSLQVSGDEVSVVVTGLASTTIDWTIAWQITEVP